MIQKFDLTSVRVLENKLNVQVFILKTEEVVLIILQVHGDELETRGVNVNFFPFFPLLELFLTVVEKPDQLFQQIHLSVDVLSKG